MPLNLPFKPSTSPPMLPKAPPPSRKESPFEIPRAPEIVDLESAATWPRREIPKASRTVRTHSPSIVSQQSGRQSEISLGILDYYMRDPSPTLRSPDLPPTPKFESTFDRFDFGVPPTPTPVQAKRARQPDVTAGAERKQLPAPLDSNPSKTYSLFPVVKQVSPPARHPAITIIDQVSLRDMTPSSVKTSPASRTQPDPSYHTQPDPSYRPRKESLSSSIRSRTESINSSSFRRDRTGKLIPLRILSGGSTTSSGGRTVSTSTTIALNSSPGAGDYSRWSDDTITSASMVPTPGPRTSFGSLLHGNETQYPDCFFEDDNEEVLLRRKFAWKRSRGSSSLESRKLKGRFDEPESFGSRFVRLMLCGCGGR